MHILVIHEDVLRMLNPVYALALELLIVRTLNKNGTLKISL